MANYSNSNQINVPEAREAMRNMKHEVANELGITLNQGYNGNISAKDAGHPLHRQKAYDRRIPGEGGGVVQPHAQQPGAPGNRHFSRFL